MTYIIKGKLLGLNEFINIACKSPYARKTAKKEEEKLISFYIKHSKKEIKDYPVIIKIDYYEKDARRDFDNIIFAQKFILDAFVKQGIIKNDSRRYIKKTDSNVFVDKKNPRIEVEIMTEKQYKEHLKKEQEKQEK
jgi:hypothetical protein